MPRDLRVDPVDPGVHDVDDPVALVVEREHPGPEVLDLDVSRTVRDQVLEVRVEDGHEVLGELPRLLVPGAGG